MVKESDTSKGTTEKSDSGKRNPIREQAYQLQQCIGNICFPIVEDGKRIIEVNVDEDTNPECAKLVREIITELGEPVRFNLKKAEVTTSGKSKEQQIVDLEKRLKELKA